MAGFTNAVESSILQLIFNATTWTGMAINATSPVTNLSVALHTADPAEGGTQSTSEVAYTSYARVTGASVIRTAAGWTISGTVPTIVSNAAAITFPTCTGSTATALYWSVGTGVTNAIIASGPLSSSPVGVFQGEESNERITIKNHALALDDRIAFFQLGGMALPTFSSGSEGTPYFVGTIVDADTITISTTASNANPVTLSTDGQGLAYKILPFNISNTVTPSFAIGALQIALD